MASLTETVLTLETLPDEILLLIYRYLSSTDILFSFSALNTRLSHTIAGYRRHVVLAQLPFQRFNSICESILPPIGAHVRLLVISNDWKGVLSKVFFNHFHDRMASTFPSLRRLVLVTFVIDSLVAFLGCLRDLPNLFELQINSLYDLSANAASRSSLLQQILTLNDNRLTSIAFDDDSLSLTCAIDASQCFSHVRSLTIELDSLLDLHQLLDTLPQLHSIDVSIDDDSSADRNCSPSLETNTTLRYFRLRSLLSSWSWESLLSIFKRIDNVEELLLLICTHNDSRLLDGELFYAHLPPSAVDRFTYFVQFPIYLISANPDILPTWQRFPQQFHCTQVADSVNSVLYSVPFYGSHLLLPYPVAKDSTFSTVFSHHLKRLTLYESSPRIAETFPIVAKCRHLRNLVIHVGNRTAPEKIPEVQHWRMPHLTFFVALRDLPVNVDDFHRLLQVSPNLYHMALNYEVIQSFLDHEGTVTLLSQRLTELLIGITTSITAASTAALLNRLSTVCPSLRHLYFHFRDKDEPAEPLIIAALACLPGWTRMISLGVAHIRLNPSIVSPSLRQWVLQHSHLQESDSFLVDFSSDTFRLWL